MTSIPENTKNDKNVISNGISIFTIPPNGRGRYLSQLKQTIKMLMGRASRGPEHVLQNLVKGLDELGIKYSVNPKTDVMYPTVHAITGADTLKHCIELKRAGKIKTLIAGPSIVVVPTEADRIYLSKEIDAILLPSQWVKDLYISICPELAPKIHIWASGVEEHVLSADANKNEKPARQCLLYTKNKRPDLVAYVQNSLSKKNIDIKLVEYGAYATDEYFESLSQSDFAIFLSHTESQGLALQEAWMRNIPTLVFNARTWNYGHYSYTDPKISAPYLNEKNGMFFNSAEDFESQLESFLARLDSGSFDARASVLGTLSNKAAAERLLEIIDSIAPDTDIGAETNN